MPSILRLTELPAGMEDMRAEAAREGFRFVQKLVEDWHTGVNIFAGPGEILLGSFLGGKLLGIGGLSRDSYTQQDGVGRIRHLYIMNFARRSGVGTALVQRLIQHCEGAFHTIRLRTTTKEGSSFYVGLGFRSVQEKEATHIRIMT